MNDATAPRPRMTKQRAAVLDALDQGGFRSAQSWHDLLRHDGSNIGLATVYRTLQALSESGDVDSVVTEGGETLYRRCETPEVHHHHLRCRVCGAAEDIDIPDLEEVSARIGAEHGFIELEHVVELTGVCSSCAAKAQH
ncbi:Fur family transcriptional regulator [Demequina zhanjiangensis]|uniref:Fur family transcriptional regulator n=1 Tax=Demequina zhanjiangensis TaxID=3051659 RepID=A0ABT8G061_9MICO|nr:Fur family transcriptional regulator [Demequina sp. SYSU T00b26]MDN4472520.1 Fur family transcriptional regulator [Demequina sp. SYSU T00b26]